MTKGKRKLDTEAALWFRRMYQATEDGGIVECRAIVGGKGSADIRRAWVNDAKSFQDFASSFEGSDKETAVYYGVALRKKPSKESSKDNILGTDLLWAEVDSGKLGWDHDACMKAIHSLPPNLQPSACVFSGYGLHLYWRLKERLTEVSQIESSNKVLRDLVTGDNTWDATRILRVPGTVNMKYGSKKECRIVWLYFWQRHDVHDLLDAVMRYGKVLDNGKFEDAKVVQKKRDAERAKNLDSDYAYQIAREDKRKTANARGERIWDRTRYGGGPGYVGLDEAIMLYTAHRYCKLKNPTEAKVEEIISDTLARVKRVHAQQASDQQWDWDAERREIRDKLNRWRRRWDGGLKQAIEAESKRNGNGNDKRGGAGQIQRVRGSTDRGLAR